MPEQIEAIEIRRARAQDAPAVAEMLAKLAAEIGDQEKFRSDAEGIRRHGFGAKPLFHCLIAESAERTGGDARKETLGLSLFFPVFSTTRGQPGVYVQDLWVDARTRGTGLGRRLLAATASAAAGHWNAAYLTLIVYDDNEDATAFYRRLGFSGSTRERPLSIDGTGFQALRRQT